MINVYSKIMLTIIAVAVSFIAIKMAVSPQICEVRLSNNKCWFLATVDIGNSPVSVEVTNDLPISVEVKK